MCLVRSYRPIALHPTLPNNPIMANDSSTHKTLPGPVETQCPVFGDTKVALREKEFGIWQSVSWQEYFDRIRHLALGLVALGYERRATNFR